MKSQKTSQNKDKALVALIFLYRDNKSYRYPFTIISRGEVGYARVLPHRLPTVKPPEHDTIGLLVSSEPFKGCWRYEAMIMHILGNNIQWYTHPRKEKSICIDGLIDALKTSKANKELIKHIKQGKPIYLQTLI